MSAMMESGLDSGVVGVQTTGKTTSAVNKDREGYQSRYDR